MKHALAILVFGATVAHADSHPRQVEALVSKNLDGLAARLENDKLGLTKDNQHVVGGQDITRQLPIAEVMWPSAGKIVLGKKAIVAGESNTADVKRFAWFQQPYLWKAAATPGGKTHAGEGRVSGLAIQVGDQWQLAGVHYAELIPDVKLFEGKGTGNRPVDVPAKPVIEGDAALGAEIAAWFASGFAGHETESNYPIASGTASTENGKGAAAVKLAKGWAKLDLEPVRIVAKTFLGGAVGFVTAELVLTVKGKPIRLVLTIVTAREGSPQRWRWLALQFSA